ncbi:MAG: hypothetical protein EBS01_07870 [Verrucomicrobia bacterium]|nr:hypothetical protein [Verrucomicrobiota bacterium]
MSVAGTTNFTVDTDSKLTIGGLLSGNGGLVKLGGGTLVLSQGFSMSSDTFVNAGRLEIGTGGLASSVVVGSGTITLDVAHGAQIAFNLSSNLDISNVTIIGGTAGTVLSLNPYYTITWNGGTTKPAINVVSPGTSLDLSNLLPNQEVEISSGTIASSGTSMTVSGAVAVGSLVSIQTGTSTLEISGVVSGTGAVKKDNSAGALVLSGSNSYSGGTIVEGGSIIAQNGAALGTGSVQLSAASALALAPSAGGTMTVGNAITGGGKLIVGGSGVVTVSGTANNYTGGTKISGGTLEIKADGALGSGVVQVDGAASLRFQRREYRRFAAPLWWTTFLGQYACCGSGRLGGCAGSCDGWG